MCGCSKCNDEDNPSECQCSPCRYRNGLVPLLVSQLLVILAYAFSFIATLDCHFVTVEASRVADRLDDIESYLSYDFDDILVASNSTTRGLGFFLWEGIDGECTPRETDDYTDNVYQLYTDFLGSDWNVPRAMASLSTALAFLLMIWLFVFSCVAHPKALRYALAICSIVLMPIFQSIPFMLLNSDFCKEYDCSMGRSAKFAAGATSVFALIGVVFLFTQNYPKLAAAEPKPVASPDLEEQTPATNEDVVEKVPADATMQEVSLADESPDNVKASVY